MNLDRIVSLTQELINAYGPCGQENEVRTIVLREMENLCDETWTDEAGNAVGLLKAGSSGKGSSRPPVRVMAHMDELSLTVKRIESDGTLRVLPLGGIFPWVFGLGPVEILADSGVLPGVLSVGPQHTSSESPSSWKAKKGAGNQTLDWPDVYVFTRMSKASLLEAGVHAGSRVVISRSRRALQTIGDCLAGYFLDDRVCIAMMLAAASMLKAEKKRPAADTYLVATTVEEIGGGAAAFASRSLPGSVTIAIDVGPVAAEYDTKLNADPIIAYKDIRGLYSKPLCDRLMAIGRELKMSPQAATWESYGSDASMSLTAGQAGAAALLCIPTENTHGFEIVTRAGIESCAKLLAAYLKTP
jgi:putative aminopeptidase FrvX